MRRNLVYLQQLREGRNSRVACHCGIVYSGRAGGSALADNGFQAMRMARDKIRWLARLMLALVLFAQGIVAASACVNPEAGPAQAYAVAQDEGAAPCHEEEVSNANACLSHCTQSDQISADQHGAPVAPPTGVIGWASARPPATDIRQLAAAEQIAPDTGPPLSIRYCSFLN